MITPGRSTRPSPLRRWRSGWLAALAMVVFYCALLGSIHGVTHAGGTHLVAGTPVAGTDGAPRWTDRLFGHQAGDKDCGLFDEIMSDVGLLPPAIPLPEMPQPPVLVATVALPIFYPFWHSAFEARAPPAHH